MNVLNDIASGLANVVRAAVNDAVRYSGASTNARALVMSSPRVSSVQQHQQQQHYSQLRQQLESQQPRLSNLNIEAALSSAVNSYLSNEIKSADEFGPQQRNQVKNPF